MNWLLTFLLCVLLVEIAVRLPLGQTLMQLVGSSRAALRTVQAKNVSDHWKEKAMFAYAVRTFSSTGRLAVLLGVLFGCAALVVWGFNWVKPGFFAFLIGGWGIVASILFATLYMKSRSVIFGSASESSSDYSAGDQILHRLALGSAEIGELAFKLDQSRTPAEFKTAGRDGRHVFVAGLARAGTTVLMRKLYASGAFRSLTYRDMPFVLAPGFWARLTGFNAKKAVAGERIHGDGLIVDVDSPEALEEPFWKTFSPDYMTPTHLVPHSPDQETIDAYSGYIGSILASGDGPKRYLSKNNNNILRLPSLRAACPNAVILVPFRDPFDQAASLLSQHENILEHAERDPFVKTYMGLLAHHEFGPDHLPFQMANQPLVGDPATIDYWLELWIGVYAYLLESLPDGAVFVCYEALCRDPDVWLKIASRVGIDPQEDGGDKFEIRQRNIKHAADPDVSARSKSLYDQLLSNSMLP